MKLQTLLRRLPSPLRRHKLVQTFVWLRPSLAIQELRFNDGARLVADVRDANARMYFLRGAFEPEFFAIARPFMREASTVFDIGANFGFCTFGLLADPRIHRLRCHLFEANAELCALLHRSAALHPTHDLFINHGCVTDQRGMSRLTVTPHDWGSSFIGPQGTHAVPNIRLDDYCHQHGITAVDFAKLDVEGHEPAVLRGAQEILRRGVLRALYFELSSATLARQRSSAEEVCEGLRKFEYRLFYCKPDDLAARTNQVQRLDVNGVPVAVAACNEVRFAAGIQTDLLAIRTDSPFLA